MPGQGHPAQHRRGEHRQDRALAGNIGQQQILSQDCQHHRSNAIGAQGRIAHDGQHLFRRAITEQTVSRIGDPVQMKTASDQDQQQHCGHGGKVAPEPEVSEKKGPSRRQGDQQADQGHPAHALDKAFGGEFDLARDRIPGHELDHEDKRAHGRLRRP